MIGAKISASLLDNVVLDFYKYDVEDVKQLLEPVRETINEVAEGWSREQKDRCLEETENAFKVGGCCTVLARGEACYRPAACWLCT